MRNSIHIIGSKICGGAERFYARLVNSLAEQTHILAINPPGCPTSDLISPTVEQIHPKMRNNQDFFSSWLIRRAISKKQLVAVQTYMGRATRLTHIPQGKGVVHIARLGGYYNLKAYRHAHHLVGNTHGICNYLIQEGVPKDRVHYIGNFVEPILPPPAAELTALRESLKIPDNAFVIACAARFHEVKGLPDLLDAFSKVWNRLRRGTEFFSNGWKNYSDARLILIGDGPLSEKIRKQIQTLEIGEAVILPGWCDPKPYYHLADVLTCPSRHEPLGNTILEAWACGKPLVATQTQGATELITPNENGLTTPIQDPDALADAFEQLMNDPAQRAALAEAGLNTVQTRFSKEVITREYLNLYERLLENA